MIETSKSFYDDLPKHNPWEDDRLGYATLSSRIAKTIIEMNAANGYVIGLHGRWGSGKSTIMNFTASYISKYNAENEEIAINIIDYRPWIVSGHQDLVSVFFRVLAEKLGPDDKYWKKFGKNVLGVIRGTTDNVIDTASTIARTVDPSGGLASGFAGGILKKLFNWLSLDPAPSLQKSYDNLTIQLQKQKVRFLVLIDDIDRLENEEIRSIMKMVKSIGRLPNVVYLLAYDREIVWKALRDESSRVHPRFTEKIVQHEIDIPKPKNNSLFIMLDSTIAPIISKIEESAGWQYIVRDGVRRWINSPRDVVRYANALTFSSASLHGMLDTQDILAMEGLRIFDFSAYEWVRENRDFLFNQGRFLLAPDESKKSAVQQLRDALIPGTEDQVIRILSVLFPQSAKYFEAGQYSMSEPFDDVKKRRGIGCEAGYDTYFGFAQSSDAIPSHVLNEFLDNLNDETKLAEIINSYIDVESSTREPMINELLEELRVRFKVSFGWQSTQALLNALVLTGDRIMAIEWEGGFLELGPSVRLGFLVRNILEARGESYAGEHLIAAFERAETPFFIADVYVDRGRELGVFASQSSERSLISKEDFDKIGAILTSKIVIAARNGSLETAPFFFDLIRAWKYNTSSSDVNEWLKVGVNKSAAFMAKVGRGLLSYSVGAQERSYTMRDNPDQDLYDLTLLAEAGRRHLQNENLSKKEKKIITAVVRGSEALLNGEPAWDL